MNWSWHYCIFTSDERGVGEGDLLRHGEPLPHLLLLPFPLLVPPTTPRLLAVPAAAAPRAVACASASASRSAELGLPGRDGDEEARGGAEREGGRGAGAQQEERALGDRGGWRREGEGEWREW